MNPQALVIGAGPVGLTLVAELARYGVAVRIVEKAPQRTDKSKALVLWSRTLEHLDRAGCSSSFVAAGHEVHAANIIAGSKTIGRVSFDDVRSAYPYALMLPQSDTERLLEAHLSSLGIAVQRQVELVGFGDTGSNVTATLRHPDGHEEVLETEWLIGCDGAHSTVRHGLGMEFVGDTLGSDWILADIHMSGRSLSESEIALYWHEDGLLAVFPVAPGRYRVVADGGRSEGAHPEDPTLDQVQAVVQRRGPGGLVVSDPVWLSAFRINERKVQDYRSGRIFLAGDAAHVHSPAGGQGMNTGMQDAVNLSWKLALVCRGGWRADKLLDSYSAERSPIGDQVIAAAGRLTSIGVIKNHAAQTVRDLIGGFLLGLAPVRQMMADMLTEVSIGYAHGPLIGSTARGVGGPAAGERVAPVDGHRPVGAGDVPRFALFASPGDEVSGLLREFPSVLEPVARPPVNHDGMWLVRPDGYTACVARSGDAGTIADYLRAIGAPA